MRFVIPIILFILFGGCGTDSDPGSAKISLEGSFAQAGLPGLKVNTFNQFEGNVYVATDGGLYRTQLGNKEKSWESLGLIEENVADIVFLPQGELMVAISLIFINDGEPTLFLSKDEGQSWQTWVNNYGGETGEYTFISSLATPTTPSDTIFAHGADRTVARSVDGGQLWELVTGRWDNFGGASRSVYINASQQETIWISGATALGQPYILKSKNNGESWDDLNILENVEAICFDIITPLNNRNVVLAGLGSGFAQALVIRKSTDGGQTWGTVFEGINTFTLAQSPKDDRVVYASGVNARGQLFFIASNDFGDSWQTVEFEGGPTQIRVNDMVSVLQNGKEVLYFGTNKGVYSFTFEN